MKKKHKEQNKKFRKIQGQLFSGIEKSSIEKIQEAINNGADVNPDNGTPLLNALLKHRYEIADYLIQHGAIILGRPIEDILKRYDRKTIDYCITNYKCTHQLIIKEIIKRDDIERVKELLKQSVDIHFENDCILKDAVNSNKTKICKYLIEELTIFKYDYDKYGLYLLIYAININDIQYFNDILNKCPVYKKNLQPYLMRAITCKNIEIVKIIVETGYDLNEFDDKEEFLDDVLLHAISCRNYEIVKYLIDNGADPKLCDNDEGNQCLAESCECGNLEIFKLIYNSGVKPYVNDTEIFVYACDSCIIDIFEYLISIGFDINDDKYFLLSNILDSKDTELLECLMNNEFNHIDEIFYDSLYNKKPSFLKIIVDKYPKKYVNDNKILDKLSDMFYLDEYYNNYGYHNNYNNFYQHNSPNDEVIETYIKLIENGADFKHNSYEFFDLLLRNNEKDYIKKFLELGFVITEQTSDDEEIQKIINLYSRKIKINKLNNVK